MRHHLGEFLVCRALLPRRLPVEGQRDRVQNRRLPRSRGAYDGEQSLPRECVVCEVNHPFPGKGIDVFKFNLQQFHVRYLFTYNFTLLISFCFRYWEFWSFGE